jgi:hypothetical protein
MNTATASSGHLLFVNGSIMDGTFECDPIQLPVLNEAITTYSSLVNKHSLEKDQKPFTGEVSLVELLAYIHAYYDISNPLLKDMAECLLVIHRKSITIH